MDRDILKGKCSLCNNIFSKATMTKHLESCRKSKAISEASSAKQKPMKTKIFHFVVEGRDLPEYWMHLEVPAKATLKDLDDFLRDMWLECCGHLSAFTIQGTRYEVTKNEFMEVELMDVALGDVLSPKMKFYHEYDFGTTTELTLRVVSERESEIGGKSVQLLARNEPSLIACELCGKIATQVCSECIYSGEGWLCDKCARKHECGEDMLLPVVNSPRVGMCGYTG